MTDYSDLKTLIETGFDNRADYGPNNIPADLKSAIDETLDLLDDGQLRVADKSTGE